MNEAPTLTTSRLQLVPATRALVELELSDRDRLADRLGVELAEDWPPEHHDADMLHLTRKALEDRDAVGWWLHYIVPSAATRPTLVGTAGYKGPPTDGVVEIGYSIVPSWRRHGFATEACQALVQAAWARGADVVLAHTLPGLESSIGVLRKLGFQPAEPPQRGVLAFSLRRGPHPPS
jgi:ribosomal-protein-alanine N-acetyltransferase